MPDIPYEGIPASRSQWLSVAPVDIVGITGMSPNIFRVSSVVALSSAGSTAGTDVGKWGGASFCVSVILMPVSAITRANVERVSSSDDVGTIRQFTFAVADCGSALYACPPRSRVATQVVRSMEL